MVISKRLFNRVLAIMSILNGYAFFFMRGFSLAMIITTVIAGIALFEHFHKNQSLQFNHLLIFVILSIFLTIISTMNEKYVDTSRIIYMILKLVVWALFLSAGGSLYFDALELYNAMKKVIVITFAYLILQYIAHYVVKISVPASFNLGLIVPNSSDYEYMMDASKDVFRPGSLWGEPGYLGYYYNSFLCIALFGEGKYVSKNRTLYILISCMGIVLSMSTGAIGIMIILLICRIILKNSSKGTIVIVVLSIIAFFGYSIIANGMLNGLRGLNSSIDNTLWKLENLQSVGRVGQSFDLLSRLNIKELMIGAGLGNELYITFGAYMNGVITIVFYVGFVGLILWFVLFIDIYAKKCQTILQKISIIVFLCDGLYAGLYFGSHSFIYILIGVFGFLHAKDVMNNQENVFQGSLKKYKYIR